VLEQPAPGEAVHFLMLPASRSGTEGVVWNSGCTEIELDYVRNL
jgi:hypothetical protein